jgi:hypothetical protein
MSTPKDGGPAFPTNQCNQGVSKRDYFAAMAMQAILSHYEAYSDMSDEHVAENACEVADALLAKLNGEVES